MQTVVGRHIQGPKIGPLVARKRGREVWRNIAIGGVGLVRVLSRDLAKRVVIRVDRRLGLRRVGNRRVKDLWGAERVLLSPALDRITLLSRESKGPDEKRGQEPKGIDFHRSPSLSCEQSTEGGYYFTLGRICKPYLFKSGQGLFEVFDRHHRADLFKADDALFIDNDISAVAEPFFFIQPAGIVTNHLGRGKGAQQGVIEFQLLGKDLLGRAVVGTDTEDFGVQFFLDPLTGGQLQGSTRGEVEDIKQQDDIVLVPKVLEADLALVA